VVSIEDDKEQEGCYGDGCQLLMIMLIVYLGMLQASSSLLLMTRITPADDVASILMPHRTIIMLLLL